MHYTMTNGYIIVAMEPKGAELLSIVDMTQNCKEYIWLGNEKYWKGSCPNLFPIVGRIPNGKYTYKGKEYNLESPHGFARKRRFDLIGSSDNSLSFGLVSDDKTKECYPFDFDFRVKAEIVGKKSLKISYKIKNTSETESMPFAFGAHPGFNVPINSDEKFEDYSVEFLSSCNPTKLLLTEDGFMSGEKEAYKLDKNKIDLRHDLFDNDAIILENASNSVKVSSPKGNNGFIFTFEGFEYFGLWQTPKSDAPFLCLEPWHGLPSQKKETEYLDEKLAMSVLKPLDTYEASYTIEIF